MKEKSKFLNQQFRKVLQQAQDFSIQAKEVLERNPSFNDAKQWTYRAHLRFQSRFPSQAHAIQSFLGTQETRLNRFLRRQGFKEMTLFQRDRDDKKVA